MNPSIEIDGRSRDSGAIPSSEGDLETQPCTQLYEVKGEDFIPGFGSCLVEGGDDAPFRETSSGVYLP